jgi:hypothetical protein
MFSSQKLNTTFKKDDFKRASYFNKFCSHAWVDPAINSANLDKDLSLKDCPDLFEQADDISDKVTEFTQNYAYYAEASCTRPFLRAYLRTFRWEIFKVVGTRGVTDILHGMGPFISA